MTSAPSQRTVQCWTRDGAAEGLFAEGGETLRLIWEYDP